MSSLSPAAAAPRHHALGIACGAGAGALWGLVFLAPELVRGFSPLMLTIGRYLCYGLIAVALLAPRWRSLRAQVSRQQWRQLFWLSLAGNTIYFLLLAGAVQNGGIAMTSLVIGFLPVAVTIIGSRDHGAVPLSKLIPSLLACVVGAACIGWDAFAEDTSASLPGLLCAVGALVSWTIFAVGNARCLGRLQHITTQDWNLLTGVVTGAQSLLLVPLALLLETAQHGANDWLMFGAVSASIALLASIFGNALWNRMSRLLPLTLVGQMILFETLFALLYGFLWEWRWPSMMEIAALACVAVSVSTCLAAHRQADQSPSH
ncbi:MAG: DMT family transporter [Pseudoxanthomonas sp.]